MNTSASVFGGHAFVGNDPVNGWDPSGTALFGLCRNFSTHQEMFTDKAIHVAFGAGAVWLTQHYHWPRGSAILAGALLGLIHEGPWGIMNAKFPQDIFHGAFGDHDLWGWSKGAKGAPCAGLFDTFFFMLPGIWYTLHLWPYNFTAFPGQARVPQDLMGDGNPFPNQFPPRIPDPIHHPTFFVPGMHPPGEPWF